METVYNNKFGFLIPDEHIPSDEDLGRYQKGDTDLINPLIEGLISFIVNEIDWYLKCNTQAEKYREDCVSEGLFALTKFVNESIGKKFVPLQFVGHAKATAINSINDMLQSIGYAIDVQKHYERRGGEITQSKMKESHKIQDIDTFDSIWFEQFMSELPELEGNILRCKIEGLNDRETGDQVGINDDMVRLKIQALREKYNGET